MDDTARDTLLVRTALEARRECAKSIPPITNIDSIADAFDAFSALHVEAAVDRLCDLGFMSEVTTTSVRVFVWMGP